MDEIPDVRLELLKTTFSYHKLFQQILDHGNEKVHLFQVLQVQNLGQQNVVEFEVEVIYIHLINLSTQQHHYHQKSRMFLE